MIAFILGYGNHVWLNNYDYSLFKAIILHKVPEEEIYQISVAPLGNCKKTMFMTLYKGHYNSLELYELSKQNYAIGHMIDINTETQEIDHNSSQHIEIDGIMRTLRDSAEYPSEGGRVGISPS